MALFRPRNRVEILRSMVARVVARSNLTGLRRNGAVFHILAAAANEIAEIYFQLARLRQLFSIDSATGSDLDLRAAEIQPGTIVRRGALFASTPVVFSRVGTVGTTTIPIGTIVAAQDAEGLIKFRTTAAASITPGNSVSGAVDVVALEAGARGNVADDAITKFVSRVVGITGVTNPAEVSNGRDRESDREFRARLKAFVQSLSRATVTALEGFARAVQLSDGRRVLFAHVYEPIVPSGMVDLFIDDGTGAVEEFSEEFILANDTLMASALGGETNLYTANRPIRDDSTFELRVNGVVQTRNLDYYLNPAIGQVELVAVLSAADAVLANYRNYTGLIQQTQKVIDGDPTNRIAFPGVRGAGVMVIVKAPTTVYQSISAAISVLEGFDVATVQNAVQSAIQTYINSLDIGEDVLGAEITERAMAVDGMENFRFLSLTGSTPPVADQIILDNQVARIVAASIVLT